MRKTYKLINFIDAMEENVGDIDSKPSLQKIGQEQIHSLLFGEKLSWQSIIYDLINTEQLDPWDINLSILAEKFLEKVRALEEANFFVSSKVLLATALLLRMKSEILLDKDLPELDNLLYGRKEEEKKYSQERIELDEEIPELVVRTPLPRFKKVTLDELMNALGNAIKTETRRIQKVALTRQQEYETALSLPKKRINIQDSIRDVYGKLQKAFEGKKDELAFSEISGKEREERVAHFVPLLHLDNQHKVWLTQEKHFDEIWILLKEMYEEKYSKELEELRKEVDAEITRIEKEEKEGRKKKKELIEEVNEDFENPVADSLGESGVEREDD